MKPRNPSNQITNILNYSKMLALWFENYDFIGTFSSQSLDPSYSYYLRSEINQLLYSQYLLNTMTN